MIQVVNGYVCLDCADVALAKQDINPAHPPNDPLKSGQTGAPSNTQSTPAVSLGGVLTQQAQGATVQQPASASQSNATGSSSGAQAPSASGSNAPPPPQQQPSYSAGALANFFA
jgi:hypothetical protein